MRLNIVLYEPEIPQNTGSIGRTCMAVGARLHLIEPLGFSLESKYLKRAGLDYWPDLDVEMHHDWPSFRSQYPDAILWYLTTKAKKRHDAVEFPDDVFLVFGKETAGLPDLLLESAAHQCLRIPIMSRARSLNLSVAVGVVAYEVLRQAGYPQLAESDPEERLF